MMRRFHAWLIALAVTAQLHRLENKGGWVVMCDAGEYREQWHAQSGGVAFGMDDNTGRFPTGAKARLFAHHRNSTNTWPGNRFHAIHESQLNRPLPSHY